MRLKRGSIYKVLGGSAFLALLGCLTALFQLGTKNITDGRSFVCQTFNGNLGNHVYQFASVFGISTLNNLTVLLGEDDDLTRYFEVPSAKIIKNRNICNSFVEMNAVHCCKFEDQLTKLKKNTSYKLGVYLQSWRYFGHVFNAVKKELTFRPHIKNPTAYIVESYREAANFKRSIPATVVGVHVRRGDIATWQFLNDDGVIVAPDSYIKNGIDYFLQRYKNVVFIVCSDGMDYAKQIMTYKNVTTQFHHISPVHDMALLSSCDHVLTTVGSFGWWSGFLSGGTVVYYKYPMREGSHSRSEYTYEDYFPPHWVGLE